VILGVGRIRDTVALDGGAVRARAALALSLTFDHQVEDGAGAASLLEEVARRLGTPAEL